MSWLDRLLGRPESTHAAERAADKQALDDLHESFDRVAVRTERLEGELRRVSKALKETKAQ